MGNHIAIKKHVTGGRTAAQLKNDPAQLHLGEHDGTVWASNRYWLTPAVRVAELLTHYNLAADKPGQFAVNGTVRQTSEEGIRIGYMMPGTEAMTDETQVLTPSLVAGLQAHVQLRDGGSMLAVYATPDGRMIGLDGDDLAWLSRLHDLPTPDAHYYHNLRLVLKARNCVMLVADLIHTITPHSYGTDPETRELVSTPAVTEDLGPRIVGMIMGCCLGG